MLTVLLTLSFWQLPLPPPQPLLTPQPLLQGCCCLLRKKSRVGVGGREGGREGPNEAQVRGECVASQRHALEKWWFTSRIVRQGG